LSSLLAVITTYIVHTSPAKANLSLKPACPFCSPAVQNTRWHKNSDNLNTNIDLKTWPLL